jgi:hypothetical protein
MVKGWVPISVREGVKQRLDKIYNSDTKRPPNLKFTAYVENMLQGIIDNDERVRQFGQFLEPLSISEDHVLLDDHYQNGRYFVELSARPGAMVFCQEDASTICMHVGFCLALPEVHKALIAKGIRPSQMKLLDTYTDEAADNKKKQREAAIIKEHRRIFNELLDLGFVVKERGNTNEPITLVGKNSEIQFPTFVTANDLTDLDRIGFWEMVKKYIKVGKKETKESLKDRADMIFYLTHPEKNRDKYRPDFDSMTEQEMRDWIDRWQEAFERLPKHVEERSQTKKLPPDSNKGFRRDEKAQEADEKEVMEMDPRKRYGRGKITKIEEIETREEGFRNPMYEAEYYTREKQTPEWVLEDKSSKNRLKELEKQKLTEKKKAESDA